MHENNTRSERYLIFLREWAEGFLGEFDRRRRRQNDLHLIFLRLSPFRRFSSKRRYIHCCAYLHILNELERWYTLSREGYCNSTAISLDVDERLTLSCLLFASRIYFFFEFFFSYLLSSLSPPYSLFEGMGLGFNHTVLRFSISRSVNLCRLPLKARYFVKPYERKNRERDV